MTSQLGAKGGHGHLRKRLGREKKEVGNPNPDPPRGTHLELQGSGRGNCPGKLHLRLPPVRKHTTQGGAGVGFKLKSLVRLDPAELARKAYGAAGAVDTKGRPRAVRIPMMKPYALGT
jgi:hypothetical protein